MQLLPLDSPIVSVQFHDNLNSFSIHCHPALLLLLLLVDSPCRDESQEPVRLPQYLAGDLTICISLKSLVIDIKHFMYT